MRSFRPLLPLLLVTTSASAGLRAPSTGCEGGDVGLPEPPRTSVELHGRTLPCQWVFDSDPFPGGDVLVVAVTVRDAFDAPVGDAEVTATLTPNAGTFGLCGCCPLAQSAWTDAAGTAELLFAQLGGYGTLDVCVTSRVDCKGNLVTTALASLPIQFSTPDLDASCESHPQGVSGVIDLGLWANGLTAQADYADYNCDDTVDVIDLGVWARGLAYGCGADACP